jgi:hypothetical protein
MFRLASLAYRGKRPTEAKGLQRPRAYRGQGPIEALCPTGPYGPIEAYRGLSHTPNLPIICPSSRVVSSGKKASFNPSEKLFATFPTYS